MLLRDRLGLPLEIETVGSSVARLGYDSAPLAFSKLQLGVASVRPVENPAVVANSDVDLPESYLGIVVVTSAAAAAAAVGTETLLVAAVSSAEDGCRCLSRRNDMFRREQSILLAENKLFCCWANSRARVDEGIRISGT